MNGWRRRRAISSNAPVAGPKRAMRRRRARRGTRSGTSDTGAVKVFPQPSPVADPDRKNMTFPSCCAFTLIGNGHQQGLTATGGRGTDYDGTTGVVQPTQPEDEH